MRLAALLVAVLPTAAWSETPMTGAEFEAYVGTSTVTYSYNSGITGVADYGPNRTLRWAFADDACVDAYWYERGDDLCFVFEAHEMSACWHFYRQGDGIVGIGQDTDEDERIEDIDRSETPMTCPGADIGV
jgi:hypothetical protein